MMNEKIQAILLKIVVDLKKMQWTPVPDWEITLKSEGHVSLTKNISVVGNLGETEWQDEIETYADIQLSSDDEITYFPMYAVYANIFIDGGNSKDVAHKMDADVAFTDADFKNESKINTAAKKIDRLIIGHINSEYGDYIDANAEQIQYHTKRGFDVDDEDEVDDLPDKR